MRARIATTSRRSATHWEAPVTISNHARDLPWCTTEHGLVVHPDDEDHRSHGIPAEIEVRDAGASDGRSAEIEVGLLRRSSDRETWFVIEGQGIHIELTLESARRLAEAVCSNSELRDTLSTP